MKKTIKIIILFVLTLALLSGCADIRPDFKVISTFRNVPFVYTIKHDTGGMRYPSSGYLFGININKEEFFNNLKDNQYYQETYDENTVVMFKSLRGNSAYFVFKYVQEANGLYKYNCTPAEASIDSSEEFIGSIDFPFYVIQSGNRLSPETAINCDFEYILNFYSNLPDIVQETGEDFIVISVQTESYYVYTDTSLPEDSGMTKLWQEYTPSSVRIEKKDDNTITVSTVD